MIKIIRTNIYIKKSIYLIISKLLKFIILDKETKELPDISLFISSINSLFLFSSFFILLLIKFSSFLLSSSFIDIFT